MLSLSARQTLWLSLIFWSGYAIVDSAGSMAILATAGQKSSLPQLLFWNFAEAEIWVLCTPLIYVVAAGFKFNRAGWKRSLAMHIPAALAITTAAAFALTWMTTLLGWYEPSTHFSSRLLQLGLQDFPRCFVTMGIVHAVNYYTQLGKRDLAASRLETKLAQAQMEILRGQLDPHFLFNTLNSIAALTKKDPDSAEEMTVKLATLLRASLDASGQQEVPLQQELAFLQSYLDIQQIRFRDRLSITLDIDPLLLSVPIPSLILQPLVENSIRHGITASAAAGRIEILARQDRKSLSIEVADNGRGMARHDGNSGEGLGLRNTRARLQQLYGTKHSFRIESTPGVGCRVTLEVPLPELLTTQQV